MAAFCFFCLVTVGILTQPRVLAFPLMTNQHNPAVAGRSSASLRLQSSISAITTTTNSVESNVSKRTKRVSLLVCPAQFCVPDDYQVLFANLRNHLGNNNSSIEIGSTIVAPLPRTEWIKVAKHLPTRNFWDATLPVHETLDWYFDAMENGLAEILAREGPNANICIIGHSIGGWVARAYLGGLSR